MATGGTGDRQTALSAFQVEVARLFFSLPAARGFLLAGGAALIAHRMTDRVTQDLDFFTATPGDVIAARMEFEAAVGSRGWTTEAIRESDTFCRLIVHGAEDLLVDMALDVAPAQPATVSFVGPTFARAELAGRKLLALFDRAEARDFADVFMLSSEYSKDLMITQAAALDAGFTGPLLAAQFTTLGRFADADLPVPIELVAVLRVFFATWRDELLR